MVVYILHKNTRKNTPSSRKNVGSFMEEATWCVLQVASPLIACGRSPMDLNGSRRNPGGDIVEWRRFRATGGPFRPGD